MPCMQVWHAFCMKSWHASLSVFRNMLYLIFCGEVYPNDLVISARMK